MNRTAVAKILSLGAVTGMRSMAGPAAVAFRYGGPLRAVAAALAAGEMAADKTPFVGNRIDAVPLGGRAVMGALVGGLIARDARENVAAGAALGAAAAVAMAHLAFHARRRLPLPNVVAGLLEDAVVIASAGSASSWPRR